VLGQFFITRCDWTGAFDAAELAFNEIEVLILASHMMLERCGWSEAECQIRGSASTYVARGTS